MTNLAIGRTQGAVELGLGDVEVVLVLSGVDAEQQFALLHQPIGFDRHLDHAAAHLRQQGKKVGVVSVKLLQPFPEAELVAALDVLVVALKSPAYASRIV